MLFAANCARLELAVCEPTALVGTILKFGSLLRLCVEFLQRRLPKLIGADVWLACFSPDVTWSTDNCLRRIFLLSFTGLSFRSIDFCLRNKFFALFGWNCCRMVDIFLSFLLPLTKKEFFYVQLNIFITFMAIQYCICWEIFMSSMQIFFKLRKTQPNPHTQILYPQSSRRQRLRGENTEASTSPSTRAEQCPFTSAETLFST